MITIAIQSIFEDLFTERLATVNRKTNKHGLPAFTCTIDRARNDDGILVSTIRLDDSLPHFQGWRMVSKLDFIDGVTLVKTLRWQTLPSEFHNADPLRCDHCGVKHQRNVAYIIRNTNDEVKQVGSACLVDFLGKSAASLIDMSWLEDFVAMCDDGGPIDEEECFGSWKSNLDLVHYLHLVQLSIRAHGWISRSKSIELELYATADHALDLVRDADARKEARKLAQQSPLQHISVADAIKWAAEQSGSDYFHNIAMIAQLEIVPRKYAGYAASIMSSYASYLQREEEKKLEQLTGKTAPIGRNTVTGTILSLRTRETNFGTTIKMTVQCDGWKFWATLPSSIYYTAKVGDVVEVTITLKPSPDNESFAFGSRPTKASIISSKEL